ncbi:hypothetical protein HID58_018692, partial [Brassica napus]
EENRMDKRNTIDRRPMGMIFCGSHFFTLLMCFCSQLGRFDGHPLVCGFFKSTYTIQKPIELLARNVYMGHVDPPLDLTIKTLYSVSSTRVSKSSTYKTVSTVCVSLTQPEKRQRRPSKSTWVVINDQNVKLLWETHVIPKEVVVQENQPHDHDMDVFRVLIH